MGDGVGEGSIDVPQPPCLQPGEEEGRSEND